jgi:glycosyltransferase involved in cell wall biosynthesis
MRILKVTATYAPFLEFGGPPLKVKALAEGLARRGHQVTVLTSDWGLESRLAADSIEIKTDRSPFGWRRSEAGVQAIYLPAWFRRRTLAWSPAVKRYCRARLKDFDVAHIFGLYDLLGPAVSAACRARKIPYIVEPIGMFVPIVRSLALKRAYHALWGNRMLRRASALIATAEQERQEMIAGGLDSAKITLRRNGVEIPAALPPHGAFRAKFSLPLDSKVVLFLGRLSPKKSPELLLRAFAKAESLRATDARLIFAGPDEGGMRKALDAEASRLGLSARVHFAGPLFGNDKWAAFRDADVFVLPSQNENFGNTAAEAAAAGTPVILTENCGIASLLGNDAAVLVKHDAEELSSALERVLGDAGLRAKLAACGMAAARRLGWAEPVEEMEALYEKLAAGRSRAAK